jgi:glycine betaine monooxygenase A
LRHALAARYVVLLKPNAVFVQYRTGLLCDTFALRIHTFETPMTTADSRRLLSELIARRRPGHSLEQAFYTSREVFEADLRLIFGRHWIYVGVEAEIPNAGDVMTTEIGNASVLIVRDDDDRIRAFHNVCRHRGARLVQTAHANVGNLVCPYHAWAYGLDGRLKHASHMAADFDKSCHGLKPVHVHSISGLLFICLSAEPPADIHELDAVMSPYLRSHGLRDCKVAASTDLVEHGNWKLTMENNRECYHCLANHPELTVSLSAHHFGFAPDALSVTEREQVDQYLSMVKRVQGEWESCGLPSCELEHLDDRVTGYRTERLPLDQSGQSQTLDTFAASRRLLGTMTEARSGGLHFWTQPNSWHHFMSDHVVTFSAIPLSPESTLLRTRWLVHKDAVEGVDYDVGNLTAVWEATNRQDAHLVELAQTGARSPAYEGGPYSVYTEGLVEKFTRWYIARLAAELNVEAPETLTSAVSVPVAETIIARPEAAPAAAVEQYTIEFTRTGRSISCGADTFILTAANNAGVRLPCSCTKGMCGTCKSKLVAGTVQMTHNGGIRQRDIDQGMILTCCSRPTSDLVIDR